MGIWLRAFLGCGTSVAARCLFHCPGTRAWERRRSGFFGGVQREGESTGLLVGGVERDAAEDGPEGEVVDALQEAGHQEGEAEREERPLEEDAGEDRGRGGAGATSQGSHAGGGGPLVGGDQLHGVSLT